MTPAQEELGRCGPPNVVALLLPSSLTTVNAGLKGDGVPQCLEGHRVSILVVYSRKGHSALGACDFA